MQNETTDARKKLEDLVQRLPGRIGSKMTGANEQTNEIIRELHAGGRPVVRGLATMLVETAEGDDVKPRYALHALATHAAGLAESQRREFAETLAAEAAIDDDRPAEVRVFLIRQLQVVGGSESLAVLGRLLRDEALCEPAAQALVAIRQGAAEPLRSALAEVDGTRRLVIVHALGVLNDSAAAPALRKILEGDADGETRLAAARSLANIGDAAAVDAMLKLADAEQGFARIDATNSSVLLAERLGDAGKKTDARRIHEHLRKTRTEPHEAHIRELADKALATHDAN